MKSSVLIALIGTSSAVKLGDVFDRDASVDFLADGEKHSYITTNNGKTYDLAQHGKQVQDAQFDSSLVQEEDNFDNGFENIDIIPGEHKKSHYFLGQNGKTYDLSTGHRVEMRHENFINGDDELVLTGDYFDRDLPEDAFKAAPKMVQKKAAPGNGAGFTYDPVTHLPVLAGIDSGDAAQMDYDSMVQLNKETAKPKAGFGFDPKTGLPVVFGDEIDWDHDFVQT